MRKNNDASYNCRVCGLKHASQPWGKDGKTPLFEICECCGVEFGYQDCKLEGVKKYRESWLKKVVWFISKKKPANWSLEEQMRMIPEEYK